MSKMGQMESVLGYIVKYIYIYGVLLLFEINFIYYH